MLLRSCLLKALVLVLGGLRAGAETASVACDELRRMQLAREGFVLVDARQAQDFAQSHIQGARNLPGGEARTTALPKKSRVVVYCPAVACSAADTAAGKLREQGYTNVAVLEGGMAEWLRKGYPVAKGDAVEHAKARPGRMKAEEARKRLKAGSVVAVDVRPANEFLAGHLPGARNVPLEELGSSIGGLSADQPVLVYDRVSSRSREAAGKLLENGYSVFELSGGLPGWVKKRYALEVK